MEKISGVYQIINIVNSKCYVGSAVDVYHRWWQHKNNLNKRCHANRHLQSAWLKYGESNFKFEVLEKVQPKKLLVIEQKYMDAYQSADHNKGYNINPKAENSLGVKRSEETKRKLSLLKKGIPTGRKPTEKMMKIIAACGKAKKGTHMSDAQKQKISKAQKGKVVSEYTKIKMSAAQKGRVVSAETRKKLRQASLGKKWNDASRLKMSVSRTGKPHPQKKRGIAMITLTCYRCGTSFQKSLRLENWHKKNRKVGPFCSFQCRNANALEVQHGRTCFN